MKKYTRLLTVFALVFVMVASLLTACQVHEHTFSNDWSSDTQYHWHAATCEHSDEVSQKGAHEDLNNDGACDVCAYASCTHTYADEWSSNKLNHWKEATCGHNVKGSEAAHADGNGDGLCDTCNYECGDHDHTFEDKWSYDGDFHWHNATCIHDYAVKSKGAHTGMSDFICDVCGYVSHEHTFEEGWTSDVDGHWHKATCEHEDTKVNYAKHIDENTDNLCDVCQFHLVEKVEYIFDPNKYATQTLESDLQVGMFTVSATTQIRSRGKSYSDAELGTLDLDQSLKLNGNKAAFTITLSGPAKVILLVRNGSGSATNGQTLNMYVNGAETPEPLVYEAKPNDPMVRLDLELEAGTYKFMCSGTTDLHYAKVTAVVEKSNLEKIEVSNAGTIDYVIGSVLDTTGLIVEKVYENGRREVIELNADAIDDSAFNKDAAGVYTISIKYTENGKEYTTSYQVTVYSVDDITLNENAIRVVKKEGEDKAASKYNGTFANSHLRHVYLKGEELSLEGLTVTVHGVCGNLEKDFIYFDSFQTNGYNKDTLGKQTITVTLFEKSKTFDVYVAEVVLDSKQDVLCMVSPSDVLFQKNGEICVFSSINDALQFLEALKLPADTAKTILVTEGIYKEKVEVTIPNLTLLGEGADKVVIEWDSLYGLTDESGFVHETDSTATLAVRYNAHGFTMSGITVSNYWNNQKVFDDNLGEKYGEHRALALLCQADKVVISQCKFLGYQDTVEFFTGRQLVYGTYISGTTDFIFGSNSTTYFYQCQIHSIETFDNKGGYITAFKGNNGGSDSAVKYGAIFDNCTFTCDANVAQYSETDATKVGLTAIGRPWGQDAAVAVINSDLGAHISKEASTGASRQERYVSMSGAVAEKANYIEYNNTGLSAISASQKGVTVLADAVEAAKYNDLSIIFAKTNGQVTYSDEWYGSNTRFSITIKDVEDNVLAVKYVFEGVQLTFDYLSDNIQAPEGFQVEKFYTDIELSNAFAYEDVTEDLVLYVEFSRESSEISKNTILDFSTPDALAAVQNNPKVTIEGSVRHNGGEIQIQGTISFKVKAGTVVTVMPYANTQYVSYTLGKEGEQDLIVLHETQSMMFFEDCTVVYTGLENNYLVSISIECPLAAGKYVFGGSTVEGDVTGILESIPGMSISGTCKTHSGGAQLGADSQIIFIAPALATVTVQGFDTNYGQLSVMVDGVPVEMNDKAQYVFTLQYASTVIIEAVNVGTEEAPAWNQSYITYINLSVPTFIEENLTVSFGSAGNYKESGIDFSGITIGDNGGDNSQVKEGSFSFAVRKGAIVTINGYSGYTAYSLSDGDLVYENITEEKWVYEASSDCILTITPTSGNNYFYGFSIVYPVVYDQNTTIDLSATGANIQGGTGVYEGLNVDATAGKFADNGSGWVQVNAGTIITLNVAEGAKVSLTPYYTVENFEIVIADGICTITVKVNDYLKAIAVEYGTEEQPEEPETEAVTYTLDISQIGSSNLEDYLAIGDFFTATVKVKAENVKLEGASYEADGKVFDGQQVSLTKNGIKLSGGKFENSISFTIAEGQSGKVVVYVGKRADKTVSLKVVDENNEVVQLADLMKNGEAVASFDELPGDAVHKYEFTLSAGTYHIGGSAVGAYIYELSVTVE